MLRTGHVQCHRMPHAAGETRLTTAVCDEKVIPAMRAVALYAVAGAVYIAIGVTWPDVLLSWLVAAAYILTVLWLVPWLVRRLT